MKYEGLFILDAAGKEEEVQAVVNRVKQIIESNGGVVASVQKMDQRTFARPTHKRTSGYYVNIIFDAAPTVIQPLRAKLALEPNVFRVQFTHVTELPTQQRAATATTQG